MIRRRPPVSSPEELEDWYQTLARLWVAIADGPSISAIDYAAMSTQIQDAQAMTPERAERAVVDEVDLRLYVSRLVDRARLYAGEPSFRAWILRRVDDRPYPDIADLTGCSEPTARSRVRKFDACVLAMYHGDGVEAYLREGERWAWVPNMGHDYIVTSHGALFSLHRGSPEEMRPTADGRATMQRDGVRYRPRIAVLVERCFGAHARARYERDTEEVV